MINQTYILNMVPGGTPPRIHVSQYDTDSRELVFRLYSGESGNGQAFSIPSDAIVTVEGTKSDRKGFSYFASADGNMVTVTITQQMTAAKGDAISELRITQGESVLGSANFILDVEEAALGEQTDMSETEIATLETWKDQALEAARNAAESEDNAATSADKAEDKAEAAAESATAAASSQNAALSAQTAAEMAKSQAETAQSAAEAAQSAAETAQEAAEAAKTSAQSSQQAAALNAADAADSASAAQTARTAAQSAQQTAESAKTAAETAKTGAETAAGQAQSSATAAAGSATTASQKADDAADSAAAAEQSAQSAAGSATSASQSAGTATSQATAASQSAQDAAGSATAAAQSASSASTNATNAANSAADAAQSAQEAAESAASAATTVDSELSTTSTNPVQNKVITNALNGKSNTNHTHPAATTSTAGFMSASDKSKLNGIASGAQVNTVTGVKGSSESTYRTGNVSLSYNNVGAAPLSHSHANATASAAGFMSSAHFSKVNNMDGYVTQEGTSGYWYYRKWSYGTVEMWYKRTISVPNMYSDGNIWYADCGATTYPFSLQQVYSATATIQCNAGHVFACGLYALSASNFSVFAIAGGQYTGTSVLLNVYVVGLD